MRISDWSSDVCSSDLSAGLAALVGHPADSTAQDIAHQHGLDLSAHNAQQITQAMCRSADLILVMESEKQRGLEQSYPLARGTISYLGALPNGTPFDDADTDNKWREDLRKCQSICVRSHDTRRKQH